MASKPKTIDLGALQDDLANAKRQHGINLKALARAHDTADASKAALTGAVEALKAATRTVLDQ